MKLDKIFLLSILLLTSCDSFKKKLEMQKEYNKVKVNKK